MSTVTSVKRKKNGEEKVLHFFQCFVGNIEGYSAYAHLKASHNRKCNMHLYVKGGSVL